MRTQNVTNFLAYTKKKHREHYVPRQQLPDDESMVSFQGKMSFVTYKPKKPTKWGIQVHMLANSKLSYLYTLDPYNGTIKLRTLQKLGCH
jgi:hypothetical protein